MPHSWIDYRPPLKTQPAALPRPHFTSFTARCLPVTPERKASSNPSTNMQSGCCALSCLPINQSWGYRIRRSLSPPLSNQHTSPNRPLAQYNESSWTAESMVAAGERNSPASSAPNWCPRAFVRIEPVPGYRGKYSPSTRREALRKEVLTVISSGEGPRSLYLFVVISPLSACVGIRPQPGSGPRQVVWPAQHADPSPAQSAFLPKYIALKSINARLP